MLILTGCHRTPPTDAHQEAATSSAKSISKAPPAAAPSSRAAAPLPPFLPDGCWSDVATDAGAQPLLDAVTRRCVRGMRPLIDKPRVLELAQGEHEDLLFSLADAGKCVRAVAAASPGVRELELTIVDPSGHVYGKDQRKAPFALVDASGPVCLPGPGKYRAVVRVRRGAGRVAVQVWRAR